MKTLEALIDSIHDKGVRMKYTEQCHFRKAEKLAKSVGRFDLLLTALILTTTAYSYFSVAYKLPLWTSVLSGIAGTFGVILAFKREALSPSAQKGSSENQMRIIVCDAGPIIHLHEADILSLLAQMGEIFLPQGVSAEVMDVVNLADAWPEWLQVVDLDSSELGGNFDMKMTFIKTSWFDRV